MLKDLILKNRSYRGYDESFVISRDVLETLVDFARLSPASRNIQPLKFFLSNDKETNAKIQRHTIWARNLPELKLPHEGQYPTAFIVICFDSTVEQNAAQFSKDVGIAAQSMLLGAAEMGLGGIMIGSFSKEAIIKELSLADNLEPQLVVALGKPVETVVLTELPKDGKTAYFRDENDVHYVPKRSLKDIIVNH